MKIKLNILQASFMSILLLAYTGTAEARKTVWCQFLWSENRELNVQGMYFSPVHERVRTKEYNRLVEGGTVRARVAADRGAYCVLNHPENTRIDVRLKKEDAQLDKSGRIPYCRDLNATVTCEGRRRDLRFP